MKKNYFFIFLIILMIIGFFAWWQQHPRANVINEPVTANNSSPLQKAALTATTTPLKSQSKPVAASNPAVPADVLEFVRKTRLDPSYEWKQPINFYGRVVDESNEPVANAGVHFEWNDISEKGTSDADATSDANGFFSLTGRKGKRLYVTVGKDGYYSSGNSKASAFEYANPADGLFSPDPNNPVLFPLRKKGIGVDLITSDYGISPDFQFHIPRDGTPIKVDLLQRKIGVSGQMQLSELKPEYANWKQATNWVFKIEIPDGGFVGENDEFPFEAPEEGYQPVMELNFQKDNSDWVTNLKTNYYIKFGNPPLYGRLQIQTGISYGGAIITYAINPTGSRNLESKR